MLRNERGSQLRDLSAALGRRQLLRCPECHVVPAGDDHLICPRCDRQFDDPDLAILDMRPRSRSPVKTTIAQFWGDLYEQLYSESDASRTNPMLVRQLEELEDLFRQRRHLAVTELDLASCSNQRVLEIGSGAGGHSALFKKHGAIVTAIDFTPERVRSSSAKLALLDGGAAQPGLALCADAELLPFSDDAFDIVYSNGVLHHTEDTRRAVEEAVRVVRPGGDVILMLYARGSAMYWLKLLPRAIANGLVFRVPEERWVGRLTEGKPRYRAEPNPITRVFSKRKLLAMFEGLGTELVSIRKSSFLFSDCVPWPGAERIRAGALRALGHHPHVGGALVYGGPFTVESRVELALGNLFGFSWNVRLRKAA